MASLLDNREAGASDGAGGRDEGRGPSEKGPPTKVVRYGAMNWVGEFSHKPGVDIPGGAWVVVQTDRGIELGESIEPPCGACDPVEFRAQLQSYVRNSGPDFCRPRAGRILRLANEQDLNEQRHLDAHLYEDIDHCARLAAQLELDLKVVKAEHLLGGERIVFYFQAPGRVDFRQLVRELAHSHRTRIEMRQVGARDEARLVADYEVCGRECCCKSFLKKLRPVNMKMAKLQKSTLDPSKVSGRCGRLRCCLRYEHVGYEEFAQRLPRVGSRVEIESGPATVLDRQILTQLVAVRTDDDRLVTVPAEEIRAFDLRPAPPKQRSDAAAADTDAAGTGQPDSPPRSEESRGGRAGPSKSWDRPRQPPAPTGDARQVGEEDDDIAARPSPPAPQPQGKPADKAEPAPSEARAGGPASAARRRRRRRRAQRDEPTPPAREEASTD